MLLRGETMRFPNDSCESCSLDYSIDFLEHVHTWRVDFLVEDFFAYDKWLVHRV